MCNAYGIEKKRKEESHHIKIFDNLKKLVDEGRVIILSNQIIISEWERNKKHCYEYVSSLKRSKEEIEQKLKQESGSIEEKEELARLKRKKEILININEQHILNVERFLLYQTIQYPITASSKIKGAEYAIEKKAPFIGKKSNSMADMVILLSGLEFIKSNYSFELFPGEVAYPKSFFVSANKKDFSSKNDENIIHEDLKPLLEETDTKYSINLAALINELFSEEVLSNQDIKDFDDFVDATDGMIICPVCGEENYGFINLKNPIIIRDMHYHLYDKNQLRLSFEDMSIEELNKRAYLNSLEGFCVNCYDTYMLCPICDELVHIIDEENICKGCKSVYKKNVLKKGHTKDFDYFLLKEVEND